MKILKIIKVLLMFYLNVVSYISRNEITTIDNSIGNLFNLTTS